MRKVNNILKMYLDDMEIKKDVNLGKEHSLKMPKDKALKLTKALHNQLHKQNKFSRVVNWVVLGMYSVLFGIIIYVIFTFILKTPQPLSILFGGGGVVASVIGIIKGIRNLSKETSLVNTVILLSRNMEPANFLKVVDVIYHANKKEKS